MSEWQPEVFQEGGAREDVKLLGQREELDVRCCQLDFHTKTNQGQQTIHVKIDLNWRPQSPR